MSFTFSFYFSLISNPLPTKPKTPHAKVTIIDKPNALKSLTILFH